MTIALKRVQRLEEKSSTSTLDGGVGPAFNTKERTRVGTHWVCLSRSGRSGK